MPADPVLVRLCDDVGLVSDQPVDPGSHGTEFDPRLTYRKLLNNLRAHGGHPPYVGTAFPCTGSAHLAGMEFRCTGPAHQAAPSPGPVFGADVIDPPKPRGHRPWAG